MKKDYKPYTTKYINKKGEVVEYSNTRNNVGLREYWVNKKLSDPNRHLKRRWPIIDPVKIQELGRHLNNGYYYNSVAISKVIKTNPEIIRGWVKKGKLPAGQFILGTPNYVINLYRFEEIYILSNILYDFYQVNDSYNMYSPEGRNLRELIFYNFKLVYDEREAKGLEHYQPEF